LFLGIGMTSFVGNAVVSASGNATRRAPPYESSVLPGLNSSWLLCTPKLI